MDEEDETMSAAPTQPASPKQKTVSARRDGGVSLGATGFDRAMAEAAKTRDNSDVSREQESRTTRSRSRELNAGVQKLTEIREELAELSEQAKGVKTRDNSDVSREAPNPSLE
eukprot:770234-Rhodomonas_salina.1